MMPVPDIRSGAERVSMFGAARDTLQAFRPAAFQRCRTLGFLGYAPGAKTMPGQWRDYKNLQAGFSLLELIVVILLLTILLGFAIPSFQAGSMTGSPEDAARGLMQAVKRLKIEALSQQRIHRLHLNLDDNHIWVTQETNSPSEEAAPRLSEWDLPRDTRIAYVRLADNHEIRSGTAVIAFYPQGYSDRALIRLTDGGEIPTDLIVEAFLPFALIATDSQAAVF